MNTSKYPPLQVEQIKSIIIDCQVRRLTNMETHMRLRDAGIDISLATVKNYKTQIKSQTQTWITKLAKSRKSEFVAQYRERIFEVEAIQRKLWTIIEAQQTGSRTQIEGCGKLLECTRLLTELIDAMPVVNALNDVVNGEYGGDIPSLNSSNSYGVSGGNEYDDRTPV